MDKRYPRLRIELWRPEPGNYYLIDRPLAPGERLWKVINVQAPGKTILMECKHSYGEACEATAEHIANAMKLKVLLYSILRDIRPRRRR